MDLGVPLVNIVGHRHQKNFSQNLPIAAKQKLSETVILFDHFKDSSDWMERFIRSRTPFSLEVRLSDCFCCSGLLKLEASGCPLIWYIFPGNLRIFHIRNKWPHFQTQTYSSASHIRNPKLFPAWQLCSSCSASYAMFSLSAILLLNFFVFERS